MATPIIYTWTPDITDDVCLLQTVVFATTPRLILNGNLTTGSPYSYISFGNVSRTVSLTSVNNLAAVNFTITGTYNGLPQTETHAGPNNTTIYSVKLFNTITSVTAGADAANVKIGTGTTGHTNWFAHDSYVQVPALMVDVVRSAGTATYSYEATLSDAINNYVASGLTAGIVVPQAGNANAFVRVLSASTGAADGGCYQYPARYSRVSVSASASAAIKVFFMQQGITN